MLSTDNQSIKWLVGFRELCKSPSLRALTCGRLLTNMAYVFCTTSIPLIIARITKGNSDFFASKQGATNSIFAAGFIAASLLGTRISKQHNVIIPMVYLAPTLGLGSVLLLMIAIVHPLFLYLSAIFLGLGTYCFRISGMTLGQSFTSPSVLGPVIVAGDTIVRIWSFIISLTTLWVFEFSNSWEVSYLLFFGFSIIIPCFALFAPILTLHLAREYIGKNCSMPKNSPK